MIRLCIMSTIPQTIISFWGDQLKYLQENGFDVSVITSSGTSAQDYGPRIPESIRVFTVKMSRTIDPIDDCRAFNNILRIIKRERFDIVQYVTPKAAFLGSLASWFARVPVRLYLMWGLYYVTQKGFKRAIFKTVERIICFCSTTIAPDSRGNLKLAVEEGLGRVDKFSVVGNGSANGVDTGKFDADKRSEYGRQTRSKLGIPGTGTVFGCIAAIVGDKGINELVEAFNDISQSHPEVYLLYVGQTTEKDPVKSSTLETMKSNRQIFQVGWQTEPERYLAAMDIFVLPTYREGLGVVNIQASAMGLPVISTTVPGPQEAIVDGQTGILVPPRQVAPLVKAMRELMDRPQYAKELGEAGRKRVHEQYEQKRVWDSILSHRRTLVAESRNK